MALPIKMGTDLYCKANSQVLLSYDEEEAKLYIGYTPDDGSKGKNYLAAISAMCDGAVVPYTCTVEDDVVLLKSDAGYAKFAIGCSNDIVVDGKGIGLVISNGKSAGIFMGGGNVVKDARGGMLFSISGVKIRAFVTVGSIDLESYWDLDALCDPDPKVFMLPDEQGNIAARIFADVTEVDHEVSGLSVEEAAKAMTDEFAEYCKILNYSAETQTALRAAWELWNAQQPPRTLFKEYLGNDPVVIHGRQSGGTLHLNDGVLYALAIRDSAEAAKYMCSFLKYIKNDGLVPYEISNNIKEYYVETPLFGVLLTAREDVLGAVNEEQYEKLALHLNWWVNNRFCTERGLFYCLHRTESRRNVAFDDMTPFFAPDVNALMALWIGAMAKIADRLGKENNWAALADDIIANIKEKLYADGKAVCVSLGTAEKCECVNGAAMKLVGLEGCGAEGYEAELMAVLGKTELTLDVAKAAAAAGEGPIADVRQAVACLLAESILREED
ncbi:MAG: hypothetical protein IJ017_05710 [Oscillospiraceae bacterium]|nr:hypothetical protein [Oscillospiraceae bacterium]